VYHPHSQGQVENLHRTMTQVLRKLLQSKPNPMGRDDPIL
jgi:hypothetical protein